MKSYITCIDNAWYAFGGDTDKNQVYSIGRDNPDEGKWFATWTDTGIKYVSSPSPSKAAAYSKAKRAGQYCGEV